jgi:hypothetical protein
MERENNKKVREIREVDRAKIIKKKWERKRKIIKNK